MHLPAARAPAPRESSLLSGHNIITSLAIIDPAAGGCGGACPRTRAQELAHRYRAVADVFKVSIAVAITCSVASTTSARRSASASATTTTPAPLHRCASRTAATALTPQRAARSYTHRAAESDTGLHSSINDTDSSHTAVRQHNAQANMNAASRPRSSSRSLRAHASRSARWCSPPHTNRRDRARIRVVSFLNVRAAPGLAASRHQEPHHISHAPEGRSSLHPSCLFSREELVQRLDARARQDLLDARARVSLAADSLALEVVNIRSFRSRHLPLPPTRAFHPHDQLPTVGAII